MLKQKTLLIIGAGIEQIKAIEIAQKMGHYVVVTDYNYRAPGREKADEFIFASTRNLDETLDATWEYHQNKRNFDGVMTIANDVPLVVAQVAKQFDLPSIPIDAAEIASDKIVMKRFLADIGVPIPGFTEIKKLDQLEKFFHAHNQKIVIKPTDNCGARGILLIDDPDKLEWAWQYAKNFSYTRTVLAEKYLSGPQLSSESIIYQKKVYTLAISDRNYQGMEKYYPFIIEDGGTMPSLYQEQYGQEIDHLLQTVANKLGIINGSIKGDLVIHNNKINLIEFALRLSGGYFCTDQIPAANGIDLITPVIKMALRQSVNENDLLNKCSCGSATRYIFSPSGYVDKTWSIY